MSIDAFGRRTSVIQASNHPTLLSDSVSMRIERRNATNDAKQQVESTSKMTKQPISALIKIHTMSLRFIRSVERIAHPMLDRSFEVAVLTFVAKCFASWPKH